jgi:transposase
MLTSASTPNIVAWIGLDWADRQHLVCLQAVGSPQVESFVLEQKPEALQAWVGELRRRFPHGQVAIALEQYRGALFYALMNYDCLLLYPIPPKSLAAYRKAFYPSGGKDDPVDAELLLDFLVKHHDRLRPWVPDDVRTRQIRLLVEHRRRLVDDRTRLTNRLTALLKGYFPQALAWLEDWSAPWTCDFLVQWPTLATLQQASRLQLCTFFRTQTRRRPEGLEPLLEQIRTAQSLTSDPAVIESSALMVQALAEELRVLAGALKRFDQALERLFASHPDQPIFESFPGAGQALAPRLLAAWGSDRDRFATADQMQRFSGVAPVTERSGKTWLVHWRLACPKFLRQSFHEFAAHSRFWSPWAQAYYQQMRGRGLAHHAAVRALAFKWIRIMYRCWKDRTPYDEHRYQQALQRRGSPLWAALASISTQEAQT